MAFKWSHIILFWLLSDRYTWVDLIFVFNLSKAIIIFVGEDSLLLVEIKCCLCVHEEVEYQLLKSSTACLKMCNPTN